MADLSVKMAGSGSGWRGGALASIALAAAVVAAYANSLAGAFLFDDLYHIVENQRIRRLGAMAPLLAVERPVVEVSLAVNYAIGGLRPTGYHVFNLAIHVLAALTLFGVVRRTLQLACFDESIRRHSTWLAWFVAAIWGVHPLTTQSVTYVIQRGESMMGLFYLLTLYCAIRGWESPRRGAWYVASVAACAVGMASKAVMVTAPVVVAIYDWVFLRRRPPSIPPDEGGRQLVPPDEGGRFNARWALYAGLAATWGVLWLCGIAGSVFAPGERSVNVGFGYAKIAPVDYLLTQPGVILWYLRLSLWPVGLCLDYDWPVATSWREVLFPAALTTGLLAATLWAVARRTPIGFAGVWFFAILAPTSSFIPIEDAAFEHRMYLPLAAVVSGIVVSAYAACTRGIAATGFRVALASTALAVCALLGYATFQRNEVYASEWTMWGDVAAKRPHNARARVALGNALLTDGMVEEAIAAFRSAVEIKPAYADGHVTLGMGLARRGDVRAAIAEYREGVRLDPNHAKGWYNLGNALSREGRLDEAIEAYRRSLEIKPSFADAHINLGNALGRAGRLDEAIAEYHSALAIEPGMARAHNNLGDALRQQGKLDEAVIAFQRAITLQPDYANAHANLAAVYLEQRKLDLAAQHARQALQLDPKHPTAQGILNQSSRPAP